MKTTTTTTTKAITTSGAESVAVAVAHEIDAVKTAFAGLAAEISKLGAIGLDSLAKELGESVNEKGRPEFNTWVRFTLAVCASKPAFTRQQGLYGIARGAARDSLVAKLGELKGKEALAKFAKFASKASQDGVQVKMSLARPAAWDIAFE